MNKKFTTVVLAAIILLFTAISLKAQSVQAFYKFEANPSDSSGNANDGTMVGTSIFNQDIATNGGYAVEFNGAGYVSVPSGWLTGINEAGFSIWFKTNNHAAPAGISYAGAQAYGNSPANFTPLMWIDSAGLLRSYYYDGTMVPCVSADTVNDDQWHHAVYLIYFTGLFIHQELWIDGVPQGEHTETAQPASSTTFFYFGVCNARNVSGMPDEWIHFNGRMDEVRGFLFTPSERYKICHNYDLLITEHPEDVNTGIGGTANMHISHTYFNPDSTYTYQWVKNGMAVLIGQTDSVLTINNMDWSDTGYYKCYVKNQNNFEVASYEGHLTAYPVSVKNTAAESVVKMYPNPADNTIYIDLEGGKVSDVSIVSLTGQTLISRKGVKDNAMLEVGSLSAGIYSICVKDADGTRYSKFVKSGN